MKGEYQNRRSCFKLFFFFFNDTATTEIYTLSLHDALPFSLPASQRVRRLEKKRLLRRAVEPLLPREVVHGRKRGFSIPAAAWLRGELEPFARETLAPETLSRQGLLQAAPVRRVLDDHVAGRADLSRQLWGLLSLTLWYERHV